MIKNNSDIWRHFFTGSDELYRAKNILTGLEISLNKEQRLKYDELCKPFWAEFWKVAEINRQNGNKNEDIQVNLTNLVVKRLESMFEVLGFSLNHLIAEIS